MHLRRAIKRLTMKDDRLTWSEHMAMIRDLNRRERSINRLHPLPQPSGGAVAYVANFHRPQNIEPIVRSLLAAQSVGRIVVSNNNPASPLRRWLRIASDRVVLAEHAEPQSAQQRFFHLRSFPSDLYLVLDDDLFLLPQQIDRLLWELGRNPSVPHGLYGQRWEGRSFRGGVRNTEGEIDVISRVYAFTAEHLERMLLLAGKAGMPEGDAGWKRSRYDDLFLSFSGRSRPRIHDAGPFVDCPSQGRKGVATWRETGFHSEREEMFRKLTSLQAP